MCWVLSYMGVTYATGCASAWAMFVVYRGYGLLVGECFAGIL